MVTIIRISRMKSIGFIITVSISMVMIVSINMVEIINISMVTIISIISTISAKFAVEQLGS